MFRALADPTRRRLLDALHERAGQTVSDLCADLDMRRQSVSQHLELLEAANLISTVRSGRRKLHYLNPVPVHELRSRWIGTFEEPRLEALDDIRRRAEEKAVSEPDDDAGPVPDYVYTTYIRASAEQVWDALTDADLTARFWGHAQVSDWASGSRVDHVRVDGSGTSDVAGRVVEADRPHRLAFTFGEPARLDDPTVVPSLVVFEIDADRAIVRLTVTHTRLGTPIEREAVGQGWPTVFANLKTLLETGDVLPQPPWEFHATERARTMAHDG